MIALFRTLACRLREFRYLLLKYSFFKGALIIYYNAADINAVRQKLEQVLTKNQVMLNDIISLTPLSIANELVQIGIISREIISSSAHDSISSEKIIKSFMVILNTKTSIADLDEQCVKFLKGLSNVGGPASEVAELIRKEWLEVVGCYNVRLSM